MPLNKEFLQKISNKEFCEVLDAQLKHKFPIHTKDAHYLLECCLSRLKDTPRLKGFDKLGEIQCPTLK